jgi:hypothetical protein
MLRLKWQKYAGVAFEEPILKHLRLGQKVGSHQDKYSEPELTNFYCH